MSGYEARLGFFRGDQLDYRFCTPGWASTRQPVPAAELVAQARALDAGRCQQLTLGDGPLAHPAFGEVVAACRALGLGGLAIETEGRPLAAPGAVEGLAAAGVERLFVVTGGLRERVHETVMQDPGGFRPALAGLRRAAASGLPLYVVLPALRWTEADFAPLLDWLRALGGVRGLLVALPEAGRVPPVMRKVLLSYGAAARLAARVFDACQRHGLEYGFATRRGLPPCAADGALDRFGTTFFDRFNYLRHGPAEDFRRVAACADCSLAAACPGVEPAYLAVFGEAALHPVPLGVSMGWKLKRLNRLEQRDFKNVSAFENEGPGEGRSLVRINGHCNMSCAFCFVDRTVPDFPADALTASIEALARRNTDHLVLSGGEPTLHPDLPALVARARDLGFRTIEIQSNGVRAADPDYARELVAAGLTKATVSLHSVDPARSDEITRLPRAFGKTIRALHNFRALGVVTQIAHVITKANYAELPATVRFLRTEFPADGGALSVCFGIAQPISDLVYTWVMPTFAEIKPHMRRALDYCLATGLGFGGMLGQGGYPPCMLDGEMRYYTANLSRIYRSEDHGEQFYKAARCRECSFDPWCVGVRRAYVETYGDAELLPFRTVVEAAPPPARGVPAAHPRLVQLGRRPPAAGA